MMKMEEAIFKNSDPPERRSRTGDDSGVMDLRRVSAAVNKILKPHEGDSTMDTEVPLEGKPYTDVALLKDTFDNFSENPDLGNEARLGYLIALSLRKDLGRYLTFIEAAERTFMDYIAKTLPYEDKIIRDCPDCNCPSDDLRNFAGGRRGICQEHQVRWEVGKNLFNILLMKISERDYVLHKYRYLDGITKKMEQKSASPILWRSK